MPGDPESVACTRRTTRSYPNEPKTPRGASNSQLRSTSIKLAAELQSDQELLNALCGISVDEAFRAAPLRTFDRPNNSLSPIWKPRLPGAGLPFF